MKKSRYIRVSSKGQSSLRQAKISNPDEVIYLDIISGSIPFKERPEGKKLIEAIDAGEINYVSFHDISRAGRNTIDVLTTLKYFESKGVTVKIDNLGLESIIDGKPNPVFSLLTTVLAEIYSMERETLLERQKEGIAIAKAKGTYKGRVKGTTEDDNEILTKYPNAVKAIKNNPNHSLRDLAKLSVSKDGKKVSMNTIKKLKGILDKEKGN